MKIKLTTFLFGLLLAVGWTSNALAQSKPEATYKAEDIKNWTYGWRNANGDSIDSKYIDEVTDPYQMYGLLRWIYMDPRFPGPTYSAIGKNGNREREVYYGGMDGGWEIPGIKLGTPGTGTITNTSEETGSVTVADGRSTANGYNFIPVYGYYFERAQTSQIIYTAAELGLQSGDKITSLTFYPRNSSGSAGDINFSGGSITVSLGTTTINSFSSNSALSGVTFTQVAEVSSYTVNDGKWTINFSTPFTYTGNNLVVQCVTTAGSYGQTYFFGAEPSQSTYRSYNSYTPARYTFVPKATFEYKRTTTTTTPVSGMIAQAIGDLTVTAANTSAMIYSLTVKSGNTTLISWNMTDNGMGSSSSTGYWPLGFHLNSWTYWKDNDGNPAAIAIQDGYPLKLDGWLFTGYNSVTVTINAKAANGTSTSLTINGDTRSFNSTTAQDYTWTFNKKQFIAPMKYKADQYKPNEEGYTALVVKLKNKIVPDSINETYDTKEQIINYLRTNVKSIQLLTDGLRIGEGEGEGTVFNCPSTDVYNRFFFLGKGQARQKADLVEEMQIYTQQLQGEEVPFRQMYEQFSPTGGQKGDDIKDFYSKMMKGEVFPVVHDCLSVIENEHEFSMSGHTGETSYDMPGMNFFIPDYRLKYWEKTDTLKRGGHLIGVYTVDGRTMNPVQKVNTNGTVEYYRPDVFGNSLGTIADVLVWYAQYDTAHHAPVTGIYLLNLHGEANKVSDYSEPDNRYYNVDLDWRSSLNEMAGSAVKQTYIIYQVVTDSVTGVRTRVPIDTVENCTEFRPHLQLDTLYKQKAHSYSLTYIIEGSPTDSDHPGFVAWSNEATVTIPGYDDFMVLKKHHFESDFEIRRVGDADYNSENGTYDEKNYYRNYLQPENDFVNGISAESILSGYDSFMLYRKSTDGKYPVAKLKFAVDAQGKVRYKITYIDENENYNEPNFPNGAQLESIINSLINN